jgi:hypothetical protein
VFCHGVYLGFSDDGTSIGGAGAYARALARGTKKTPSAGREPGGWRFSFALMD